MRNLVKAAAALLLVTGLAACGNDPSASDKSAGGGSGDSFKVAFIMTNLGNPYNDSITKGLKKAADEIGFKLSVVAPAEASAAGQVPFIQDQVTKGVDAILITPNDPAAVQPALKQAVQAGVKVFAINSDQIPEVRTTAFTPVDFSIVPSNQLDLLSDLLGGPGDFAILSATTSATFQKTVVDATKKLVDEAEYSDLKLVQVAYGDDDPQKSTTETLALLTSHPDLDAITAPTTVGLAAAAQAVESANKSGDIVITGLGNPNQMRAYIKSGTVKRFQLWDPILHGYVTGHFVKAILSGEIKGDPGDSLDVPGSGKLTISPDGVLFTQDKLTTFDTKNIDDYDF